MMDVGKRPWLDQKGNFRPDEEIRNICREWDSNTWEEYLKNFEVDLAEVPWADVTGHIDEEAEDCIDVYKNLINQENFPQLKKVINAALVSLGPTEQEVIRLLYWEGMSTYQAADHMKIHRKTITKHRDRALKKVGQFLVGGILEKGLLFIAEK